MSPKRKKGKDETREVLERLGLDALEIKEVSEVKAQRFLRRLKTHLAGIGEAAEEFLLSAVSPAKKSPKKRR